LNENISLTPKQYKALEKYQDLLRYLAANKNYFRKDPDKRKYINQSVGFLPLLLAPTAFPTQFLASYCNC